MSSSWLSQVNEALVTAQQAAWRLAESPRLGVLLEALRRCMVIAEGAAPDPASLGEAIRGAMQPATVMAAEGDADSDVMAALAEAFNASLLCREDVAETPPETSTEAAAVEVEEVEEALSLLGREPHGDWRPAEGITPEPPPVRLLASRKTFSVEDYYRAIVEQCLEAIGAFARDRAQDPFAYRPRAEEQILANTDAILAAGRDCIRSILAFWAREAESPRGWGTWAATFALSCIEGADALHAVQKGLERLAPDAGEHAAQAAEALAISRHPDRLALGRDLVRSPHPLARAVGVDVLARAGELTLAELRRHIFDANLPVMASALRAVGRLAAQEGASAERLLELWLHFPDAQVAWLAATALLRWGNKRPYEDLRSGGKLASILGAERSIEILVLAGSKQDLPGLVALVARAPRTPALLSALGRFGHPGIWAFLLHQLGNEELVEAATEALVTLFGACVEPDALTSAGAWRSAIGQRKADPEVRYRRGEPWRPGLVAAECSSGELSRIEIEPRIEELRARVGIEGAVELGLWTSEAQPTLEAFCAAARRHDEAWSHVGWAGL